MMIPPPPGSSPTPRSGFSSSGFSSSGFSTAALALALVLAALVAGVFLTACGPAPPSEERFARDAERVAEAFRDGRSNLWVEVEGEVVRILDDDLRGSRHQRFIVELAHGQTLLVAHNIDLAPRLPVSLGDRVALSGEYEWNSRGGVIHWTHHDPAGRRPGGWVEHGGRRYR